MKSAPLYFLLALLITVACKNADDNTQPIGLILNNEITVGNDTRNYALYVPESQSNSPVVILLHGGGDSAEGLIGKEDPDRAAPYFHWIDIANENNVILAIPNGTLSTPNFRGWNDCRSDAQGNPGSDDVRFISMMLEDIAARLSIDESRIYATGSSNGGHMTQRLAAEIPDRLAAVAVIIAGAPVNNKCQTSLAPMPILFMNGTDDPIAPFEGGEMASNRGVIYSAQETIAQWVERNGITAAPDTIFFPDVNRLDRSTARRITYAGGTDSTEVVLHEIVGGGHTEPSRDERYSIIWKALAGEQNGDIEMAEEVWEFFKFHHRP